MKHQPNKPLSNFYKKAYPLLLIGVFLTILIIPLANLDLNPATLSSIFYGRLRLIRLITDMRVAIGDRIFATTIIGKDGWLFQTSEDVIENYQNAVPFTEKQLQILQQNLDKVAALYKEQGASLVIVIAPNKSSIYPEYMPSEIKKIHPESRFDQVVNYLKLHGETQILDLRQKLIAARKDQQVYYQTDSHWTEYGAYLVYQEILSALQSKYPQVTPRALSDFKPVSEGRVSMDLAELIGSIHIKEEKITLQPIIPTTSTVHNLKLDDGRWITMSWNANENLPRAVLFYDSFFYPILPWFNDHFSQVTYIPHFANLSTWNLSWTTQQKADVIIVEIAEKYIHAINTLLNPEKVSGLTK